MKSIVIAVALVAITALGVGATVAAKPHAAKQSAACDLQSSCSTMSAEDCASCPTGCTPCCEPCAPEVRAKASR